MVLPIYTKVKLQRNGSEPCWHLQQAKRFHGSLKTLLSAASLALPPPAPPLRTSISAGSPREAGVGMKIRTNGEVQCCETVLLDSCQDDAFVTLQVVRCELQREAGAPDGTEHE